MELLGEISGPRQLQLASEWYQPWGAKRENGDMDLKVRYSTMETVAGAEVSCSVDVQRTAFRGFGMMIAQVGLPPGAEVDRAALAKLAAESPGVERAEVSPDHVTFYLWPQAPGVSFAFRFRPRFPLQARTAQSVLYDFYNPTIASPSRRRFSSCVSLDATDPVSWGRSG